MGGGGNGYLGRTNKPMIIFIIMRFSNFWFNTGSGSLNTTFITEARSVVFFSIDFIYTVSNWFVF